MVAPNFEEISWKKSLGEVLSVTLMTGDLRLGCGDGALGIVVCGGVCV